MATSCSVLLDHVRDGRSVAICEDFDPVTLTLNDGELSFSNPVHVKGNCYLAEDLVVVQLDIEGSYHLPCSVCNQPVTILLILKNAYITKPLSECLGGKVHFMDDLRETILLEVSSFAECNKGHCPQRTQLAKYLKQQPQKTSEDLYYPFDGLEEQINKQK